MTSVAPIEETHDIFESTCECFPDVEFVNGHMLVVHNLKDETLETKWGIYEEHKQE